LAWQSYLGVSYINIMKNIVFIGAGKIGTAIGGALQGKDFCLAFWDKDPSKVKEIKDLSELVPTADFLFFCVPSWVLREAVKEVASFIRKDTIVISPSKGIEIATNKSTDEVLKELLPAGVDFALLSGPMLADEICKGNLAAAVVGTEKVEVYHKIKELFIGTNLKVEHSADVHGVALGGIFKNVYALALGMAEGLGWGSNEKGILVTEAIAEMQEIFKILGGKPETVLTVAGLGDFIATGFSPCSKNYTAGLELARDGQAKTMSEGLSSFDSVIKLLSGHLEKFPLLSILKHIIKDSAPASAAFSVWVNSY